MFLCESKEIASNSTITASFQISVIQYNSAMKKALLSFLLIFSISVGNEGFVNAQKTWCVANPSTGDEALLANLNYACSQVNCGVLQNGCPCSLPNSLINHASVAMNLYYRVQGRNPWNCYFDNSGLIVITDPSYGSCIYE